MRRNPSLPFAFFGIFWQDLTFEPLIGTILYYLQKTVRKSDEPPSRYFCDERTNFWRAGLYLAHFARSAKNAQ